MAEPSNQDVEKPVRDLDSHVQASGKQARELTVMSSPKVGSSSRRSLRIWVVMSGCRWDTLVPSSVFLFQRTPGPDYLSTPVFYGSGEVLARLPLQSAVSCCDGTKFRLVSYTSIQAVTITVRNIEQFPSPFASGEMGCVLPDSRLMAAERALNLGILDSVSFSFTAGIHCDSSGDPSCARAILGQYF